MRLFICLLAWTQFGSIGTLNVEYAEVDNETCVHLKQYHSNGEIDKIFYSLKEAVKGTSYIPLDYRDASNCWYTDFAPDFSCFDSPFGNEFTFSNSISREWTSARDPATNNYVFNDHGPYFPEVGCRQYLPECSALFIHAVVSGPQEATFDFYTLNNNMALSFTERGGGHVFADGRRINNNVNDNFRYRYPGGDTPQLITFFIYLTKPMTLPDHSLDDQSHNFMYVSTAPCHYYLEPTPYKLEAHHELEVPLAPVPFLPFNVRGDTFDLKVSIKNENNFLDRSGLASITGECVARDGYIDPNRFFNKLPPVSKGYVVGNPCGPSPVKDMIPELSSIGRPPYRNVRRVCISGDSCIFSESGSCDVYLSPDVDQCEVPSVQIFLDRCCRQKDPCNKPRMSFLLRLGVNDFDHPDTAVPFSPLFSPDPISSRVVVDPEKYWLEASEEYTVALQIENCPLLRLELSFDPQIPGLNRTAIATWQIGSHWGYNFAIHEVGNSESIEFEDLTAPIVGSSMMAINHYAPQGELYAHFGTNIDIGYESYVIVFRTHIVRDRTETCNLEVVYSGSIKVFIKTGSFTQIQDWVRSPIESVHRIPDVEFYEGTSVFVEIMYRKYMNLETNIALMWTCDVSQSPFNVKQPDLADKFIINGNPHYVVPLGYLHTEHNLGQAYDWAYFTIMKHEDHWTIYSYLYYPPKANVFLTCVPKEPVLVVSHSSKTKSSSHCGHQWTPQNYFYSISLLIYPSSSGKIATNVNCTFSSEDSRFNKENIRLLEREPVEPFMCQVGFDFSSSCSGRREGAFIGVVDTQGPSDAHESVTIYLLRSSYGHFQINLQVQGQLCHKNHLCIIGAVFQYGDEIFGVYKPHGESTCRPMCINSQDYTRIKIVVEEGRYVLSTLLGIRIEVNVVYSSRNDEFLDVTAYVPHHLRSWFEDVSWCFPGDIALSNLSHWNVGTERLDSFPERFFLSALDPPELCEGSFDSGLTDVCVSNKKIPCTPLVDESIEISEQEQNTDVCAIPSIISSVCRQELRLPEVVKITQQCDVSDVSKVCPRTYRQKYLSALYSALRNALKSNSGEFCEDILNKNPNLCGGRGQIGNTGCKCEPEFPFTGCSSFETILDDLTRKGQQCEDRSAVMDSRTGEVWKCFKGYCMYSRNGVAWEGLPSSPGESVFCLNAISWNDPDKRSGRTLWGYTNNMTELHSVDDGKTWQPALYVSIAKNISEYSLTFNITNKSPSKKGNSHDRPQDAVEGRLGYFWWMTFEELCVQSSHFTTIVKPMIFCSKWWCDCLDVDEWGSTFGVQ